MRNPKHIVLTGASSGIGAALARLYGQEGQRLSIHGRDSNRLKMIADEVKKQGAHVTLREGDVRDKDKMRAWINKCDNEAPIDLLIANAGISAGKDGYGESDEQSRAIFQTNLEGVLNTVQPALPLMKQRKSGQIAMISSLAGFRGIPRAPSYAASKAAVRIYGEALRGEFLTYGVSINVVCPGFIKTPMTDVNQFPMPFMISAEKAAHLIQNGLRSDRPRIAFPLPMYMIVRLMAFLPQSVIDGLILRLPKKAL